MKRPCPVCGSSGARKSLHHQKFLGGPLGNGYNVVVCNNCGAGFADETPSQMELDEHYSHHSKYEYVYTHGVESEYDYKRFKTIANEVKAMIPDRSAKILDIGCATGGLLTSLSHIGYQNLYGCDPSSTCVAAASRLPGLFIKQATIAELKRWDFRFDLIMLVGVLEHLRDVKEALEIARGLLTPSGLLYCAQPDVEGFTKCKNAPFQQFSVEHINFFSEHSLVRLMARIKLSSKQISHWLTEWREGVTDSVVSGFFENVQTTNLERQDNVTRKALESYINVSRNEDILLVAAVEELVRSGEPILIWGAGTLARRLLATTRLRHANIAAFIDSDPHIHGNTLAGADILSPLAIIGRHEPIVICSQAFECEIVKTIRNELRLTNRVIILSQASRIQISVDEHFGEG